MNKDFLSLFFNFVHTDAIGALLTVELYIMLDVYQKGHYELLPWLFVATVLMLLCKSLLKADKTQKRESKKVTPPQDEEL